MAEAGIQVVERVFDILEALSDEPQGLGVTEIAKRLNLNKTTVHRIINGIVMRGYVEKTERGQYRLGLKFIALSSHRLNNIELSTEARPFLIDLTNQLGQSSHLAILDGSDAVYIDKVEMVRNQRLYSDIGKRIPMYCSALGKSLVFHKTEQEITNLLRRCQFQKLTPKTLTGAREVLGDIAQGRLRGWTIDDEEHDLGIRCLAAPIYDYTGRVVAAVSTSGNTSVYTLKKLPMIGDQVVKTARLISERMGYYGEE